MRAENSNKIDLQDFKEKLKICIVSAPYYKDITDNLIRGALNVLKKIKACETGTWEHMVPKGVSNIIIEKSLFGMKCKIK